MRQFAMPGGEKESQAEVLRQLSLPARSGCVAQIRALMVNDDGLWKPVGGRIDVSRPGDGPIIQATPIGGARVLVETVELNELAKRLEASFAGQPFIVGNEAIVGHVMDSGWIAARYTDSWREFGTTWPFIELTPVRSPTAHLYAYDVYEAEGSVEALDGLNDCVRLALGYSGVGDFRDVRGKRFAINLWDYRGVFHEERAAAAVRFDVLPADDPLLKLALVVEDYAAITRKTLKAPNAVSIPIAGALRKLNMTLRHGEDIVCELRWSEDAERFRLQHDGIYLPPPVGPEADPLDTGSVVAENLFPFMSDATLAQMVARDLGELDGAIRVANVKCAVLLAGSILEAVLLDVLGRNEAEARKRLGKDWPDRASANALINKASTIIVTLDDGSTRPLLPLLTSKKGTLIVDHRDLIHPRAEIRGGARIDMNTVQTMQGVLREVLRDLNEAHVLGVLAAYASGKIV